MRTYIRKQAETQASGGKAAVPPVQVFFLASVAGGAPPLGFRALRGRRLAPEAARGGFMLVRPYWHSPSMRFRAALTPFSE